MSQDPPSQNESGPPPAFTAQVKQALDRLYDIPSLQRMTLAQEPSVSEQPGKTPSGRLQQALVAAIEALDPGPDVASRTAPQTRLHDLLVLRYVEGMTTQEAAHRLGISRRQAHRDLWRGIEGVAAVLWARRPRQSTVPNGAQLPSIEAEIAQLETHAQPVDVRDLLRHALAAVERLAEARSVAFETDVSSLPVIVSTDPSVAQQILVSVLSSAAQQSRPGLISLALTATQDESVLTLQYPSVPTTIGAAALNSVAVELAARLGWTVGQEERAAGIRRIVLRIAAHRKTILIIDDNPVLAELLDRYLVGHACRTVPATDSREALRLAEELMPDAILLDVMMPGMDGWELLQRLRTRPQTATIPVIICSVFNDPELAYSLGASLFLSKPIRRDALLAALQRVHVL